MLEDAFRVERISRYSILEMTRRQHLDIIDKRGMVMGGFHLRLVDGSIDLVDVFMGVIVLGDQGVDVLMKFDDAIILNVLPVNIATQQTQSTRLIQPWLPARQQQCLVLYRN